MMPDEQQPIEENITNTPRPVPPETAETDALVGVTEKPTVEPIKKPKHTTFIFITVIVLALASMGVVFGLVLPNQSENVLKVAFENTAKQTKVSFNGVLKTEFTDKDAPIKAANFELNGQSDSDSGAFQLAINATGSGISIPSDFIVIDNNAYFKVGDLSTIKELAKSSAPEYASIIDKANAIIANQWIEFDETLIKQAGIGCSLESLTLTDQDVEQLQQRFEEVPFIEVKETSDDQVEGRDAYKYQLAINDDQGAEYAKGLQDLPIMKKLQECSGQDAKQLDTSELADGDITPLTIWVDKSNKTISKIASESTQQDLEQSNLKASLEISFNYGEVNIQKPTDTKPAAAVLAELQKLLFGGFNGNFDTLGASDEKAPLYLPEWLRQTD